MNECTGCMPRDEIEDCPVHGWGTECGNCGGVRCMHFVLRDWYGPDFDECDGWCCPCCRPEHLDNKKKTE